MSLKKWLITNGIGGHCLDISTQAHQHLFYLPVKFPLQTRAMIHRLHDQVRWQGNWVAMGRTTQDDDVWKFELEIIAGLPQFKFFNPFFAIEKLIYMLPGQNALFIRYTLRDSSNDVSIRLCPSIPLEESEESFTDWRRARKFTETGTAFSLDEENDQWLYFDCSTKTEIQNANCWLHREDEGACDTFQPFAYEILLNPDEPVTFKIGLEYAGSHAPEIDLEQELLRRHKIRNQAARQSGSDLIASYAISATDFLVDVPTQRTRSHLALVDTFPNPEVKICTMLKCTLGLLLCLGNVGKSRQILNSIRSNADNGVLQSLTNPLQNGIAVEAGLWYINAVFTHFLVEKKQDFLAAEYPFLLSIFNAYSRGAIKGCYIDESDGFMVVDRSAPVEAGNGLDRWRIATRGEKRIEIQALFYNALCILLDIASRLEKKDGVAKLEALHDRFRHQFLKLFWLDDKNYLVDNIEDGRIDHSFRSAQLLTLALSFTPLSQKKGKALLALVKNKLCTPFGVRTLEPLHPAYQGKKLNSTEKQKRFCDQGHISLWATKLYVLASLKNGEKSKDLIDRFNALFKMVVASGHLYFSQYLAGDPPYEPFAEEISAMSMASLLEMFYALHADNLFPTGKA